jgi:hypothetical protein
VILPRSAHRTGRTPVSGLDLHHLAKIGNFPISCRSSGAAVHNPQGKGAARPELGPLF